MKKIMPYLIIAGVSLAVVIAAAMFIPQVRSVLVTGKFTPPKPPAAE